MDQIEEENEDKSKEISQYDTLISWMLQRLDLVGYPEPTWEKQSGRSVIVDFITGVGPKTLSVVKRGEDVMLVCDETGTEVTQNGLVAYFLRSTPNVLTIENIKKEIQFGTVGGKGLSLMTLDRMMRGLVEKQVSSNNELTGHYHRCMATLTDTLHYSDGRTVLYCPSFEYSSVTEAAKDKER